MKRILIILSAVIATAVSAMIILTGIFPAVHASVRFAGSQGRSAFQSSGFPTALSQADSQYRAHVQARTDVNGSANARVLGRGLPGQLPIINSDGVFFEAPGYNVGYEPFFIASGDFNGDGLADLVTSNACGSDPSCPTGSSNVIVLLNNGDGTFRTGQTIPMVADAFGVGDFNHDGKLDLAILSDEIVVFLGNGDGTFTMGGAYGAGAPPSSLAVGDVNGDGNLDFVTGNYNGTIGVLLGNGDGSFQTAVTYPTLGVCEGVTLGDFNGDGYLDVAATNEGNSNNMTVHLNNGQGQFPTYQTYPAAGGPENIATADFNGDGKLDIAVAEAQGSSVDIYLGNGDGTFGTYNPVPVGGDPFDLGIADFNGDGHPDIAVTTGEGVIVLLGNGAGTFAGAVDIPTPFESYGIAVGNYNGHPGFAAIQPNCASRPCPAPGVVSVGLGNGDGTFQGLNNVSYGVLLGAPVAGDFNSDGRDDVAAPTGTASIGIFLSDSNGHLQPPVNFNSGAAFTYMTTGDFNGDGNLDLVTANEDNTISILLGNGKGKFRHPVKYPSVANAGSILAVDLNGDGKLDMVVGSSKGFSGEVAVLLGNGNGSFQPPVSYPAGSGYPSAMAAADLNGDGLPDLIVSESETDGIVVLLNQGGGKLGPPTEFQTGYYPTGIATGDFNHDGKIDIAVSTECGSDRYCQAEVGSISVLLGNGDGTFQPQVAYSETGSPSAVAAMDFNGDGNLDLVSADGLRALDFYSGNGDGTFVPSVPYSTGGAPFSISVGDFNGDHQPDVAIVGGDGGFSIGATLGVLLNATGTLVSLSSSPNPSQQHQSVTFTVTIAGSVEGEPVPTGSVTLYDGSTELKTGTLSNGDATFVYSGLSAGKHKITAHYSGDSNFSMSTSNAVVQVVNQ